MQAVNIDFYSENADDFFRKYQSVNFEQVHRSWMHVLPEQGLVLDVGCGSGRDAWYLANKGLKVVALEPAEKLLQLAKDQNNHSNITWIVDQLPEMSAVANLQMKFDLILVSAVWMHLPSSQRERAFRKLKECLKPGGKLIITYRIGKSEDKRIMHTIPPGELERFASQFGLTNLNKSSEDNHQDVLGREGVRWETVILSLPDDGTGAFPLIRNIVINDRKSSTYKLALLRCLIRIAEGHPGAVVSRDDNFVELPLGLLALYWLRLYKPLIDKHQIQQSNNSNVNLSFVTDSGWLKLTDHTQGDFSPGAVFMGEHASAVLTAFKDIRRTISEMPSKKITLPNSQEQVFKLNIPRGKRSAELSVLEKGLVLDVDFFKSLGSFFVPKDIWDVLTRFSVWIEPTVVNEWQALMSSYKNNIAADISFSVYRDALTFEEPKRQTDRIRVRVHELLESKPIHCVWTNDELKSDKKFDIDHAFPFSRWPNNDLWNLLPTTCRANRNKSDKLVSAEKLGDARERITWWWENAWKQNEVEFFTQATLALPQIMPSCRSFDDVFEAMRVQRDRIKDFQQLIEWS